MKAFLASSSVVILTILAFSQDNSPASNVSVSIKVTDTEGAVIEDVRVFLVSPYSYGEVQQTRTSKVGVAEFKVKEDLYDVLLSAGSGFKPYATKIAIDKNHRRRNFVFKLKVAECIAPYCT
jgi:hypothetical protein